MLSFFPRGVLDEILNLIESVSEGFPSYSCINVESMVTQRCVPAGLRLLIVVRSHKEAIKFPDHLPVLL